MLAAIAGLVPVLLFLALLVLLDSFKLVKGSAVAMSLTWGGAVALLAIPITHAVELRFLLSTQALVRYVGPIIEEALKLIPV